MIDRAIALLGVAAIVVLGVAAMPNRYGKWRPFGYVAGFVLLALAVVAWFWPESQSPQNGDCNTSNSTVGGDIKNNCHNTVINPLPPPPHAQTTNISVTQLPGGDFMHQIRVHIESSPSVGVVRITPGDQHIKSIRPEMSGLSIGETISPQYVELHNKRDFVLEVVSDSAAAPNLKFDIQ